MRLRKTKPADLPQLDALWAAGFADTPAERAAFFDTLYPAVTGFCAEEGGRLIAAAYALPQTLAWGERTVQSAYLYALTTHPDYRRQGICAALLAYAEKELKKCYVDCLTLVPATDALRAYYTRLGFRSSTAAAFTRIDAPAARGFCETLTPQDYAGLRETLLYDTPHVRYSLPQLQYQAASSGFYRLELGPHYGCACARLSGETLFVEELLPDASLLPALLRALPAAACRVRSTQATAPGAMCKWLTAAQLPEVYLAFDFA